MEKVKEKKGKGIFWLLGVSAFAVALLLFCQFFYADNGESEKRFYEGTSVNGIDISHLTEDEANSIIEYNLLKTRDEINLSLSYGEQTWSFKGSDFSIVSDVRPVLKEVMKIGREGNVFEKAKTKNKIRNEGLSYNISYKTVLGGIDGIVENISSSIERDVIEPQLVFVGEKEKPFEVVAGQDGLKVNKKLLYQRIEEELSENQSVNIEIPVEEVKREKTEEELFLSVAKRSEFSTNYSSSTNSRKNNVKKALENFNGKIVLPNEEVSFNQTTGNRTTENGYEEANIIVNGVYVKGTGGGACQASTTLYNALILSNLEILEVNHHSLPASYVPLSFDAMVSEVSADLRFRNNLQTPIYFITYGDSENVTVEIYGQPFEEGEEIKTRAEFIKVLPHGGDIVVPDTNGEFSKYVLYKGEYYRQKYPKEGYESKAYLCRYLNGELVEEKEIRHDFYMPQNGIVIEGVEDMEEGMTLPKNSVKLIAPQQENNVKSEVVTKRIEKNNPSEFNQ